jgi:hypothetical protein
VVTKLTMASRKLKIKNFKWVIVWIRENAN